MSCPAHVSSLPASVPSVRTSRSDSGTVGHWRSNAPEACGCSTERHGSALPPQQCEPATCNWFVSRWTGAVAVSRSWTSQSASACPPRINGPLSEQPGVLLGQTCVRWPWRRGRARARGRTRRGPFLGPRPAENSPPLLPQVVNPRFHSGSLRLASRVPLCGAVALLSY